jgi:membrane associated rhomboid family serine protease
MALPIGSRDAKDPTNAVPIITIGLAAVSVLVFLYELSLPQDQLARLVNAFALVPCEYTGQCELYPGTPDPLWITLFTSMFMHASWDHLLGNMLFLLVFGTHVERSMGTLRYLGFYLLCGLGASALEIVTAGSSTVPGIGASGAISGVLAAYLVLYPKSHVDSVVPIGHIAWTARIPAWLFIGGWFLFQMTTGIATFGDAGNDVAYAAHVGGFITGLLLVRPFSQPDRLVRRLARQGPARLRGTTA